MLGITEEPVDVSDLLRPEVILRDYRIAVESRQASLIGRREVLSGRAKFGIFGDGKEIANLALAHAFQPGDFRSGYYRDQTFMFALGIATIQQFFAQLYAHADADADPFSAGRQMNAHFATRSLNPDGSWKNLTQQYNSSADVSCTGSQMPRLVGLAFASRLYREVDALQALTQFSNNGNEVAFGTIGNASCAEGMFWEAINAIGVLRSPVVIAIWDDEYGISVHNEHQHTKASLSDMLSGFRREADDETGYDIYTVPGWDYPLLVETFHRAAAIARETHTPSIVHVVELTQPQGHSTSGSHERYKSAERLAWEESADCVAQMRALMIAKGIATAEQLDALEEEATAHVYTVKDAAWQAFTEPILAEMQAVGQLIDAIAAQSTHAADLKAIKRKMLRTRLPQRRRIMETIYDVLLLTRGESIPALQQLVAWRNQHEPHYRQTYERFLYSESAESALNVTAVPPRYATDAPSLSAFEILNHGFDAMLARDPRIVAFGEDLGKLGGVNQGFAGLQAKYGALRVSDVGIRESTIIGQAVGLAMRGLRPIAEIQYLDYMLYALQILSDDLATVLWRSAGGQKAPVIVRTRGHRLEGIWHAGSPMAGIINLVRGMHVLVPRDMTQAVGFYNTLLDSDEPGMVVEVLSGYRLKERLPDNIAELRVPVGVPEILRAGRDVTVVTYGACCAIALQSAEILARVGIDVELIDVQSLLPFDRYHTILESLKKTSRIVFMDEDVPGGTTAFMLQEVLEKQGGYHWLDAEPRTLSARAHRPSYGTDGGYFSKPSAEELFDTVYELMHDADPQTYPIFYR
ncbi:MAG: thiamine pyrophosphate-dependent enzyme [Anaerolineae bacterium]|nr:thiamine pyrophosphate-dependent enzyme [Anaerolineae bacterium]